MPILKALLGDKRAIDASQFPFAAVQEAQTHAGVSVTQDSALKYGAVYACIRLISDSMASLPWDVFISDAEKRTPAPTPRWLQSPNPETTPFEFKQRVGSSLESDGNAYVFVSAVDDMGFPIELWNLHPSDIEPKRADSGAKYFTYKGTQNLEPWRREAPSAGKVLHIKAASNDGLRGLSPIDQARQAIALGLVTEQFGGRFFGSGQTPSGVIQLAPGVKPTEEFKSLIKETWVRNHGGINRSHTPAILAGAEWKPITVSPEHAQFLETRKFQVTEIARWFGVPPHFIGDIEKSSSWGTGIEQQSIGFVVYSLTPRIVRVEQALSSLLPFNQYMKLNVNGLLRGDMKTRYESYAIGKQNGYLNTDDIRAYEDLDPVEGGDEYVQQMNLAPIGQLATFKERIESVGALIRAGFDPTESMTLCGLDPIKHSGLLPVTVQSDEEPPTPGATP